MQNIPSVDLADFLSDDPKRKTKFIEEIGAAYEEIGFVALKNHFLSDELVEKLYSEVEKFFQLPVLFCIENNGYGLSTPTNEQYRCENLADRGKGYGMESHIIDGNNILEVYSKVTEILEQMRKDPKPVLIEFKTFRRRGHEEASGTKYVPEDLMEYWEGKDPVEMLEKQLLDSQEISPDEIKNLKIEYRNQIEEGLDIAAAKAEPQTTIEEELDDVFYPFELDASVATGATDNIRFIDAIQQGLRDGMQQHDDLIIMGQDIAGYGGVFKITDGFMVEFGADRVRNTPICESAIVETAMGLSIAGMKAVVEMQFADFVSSGFNPIVNYLAKSHYRWNQKADVVIRMPCGAGVGAGPFHSQTNESWFYTIPGLKIVYPSTPEDAKGLLLASIKDPNPVLFFEHKGLYRSLYGEVPSSSYTTPLGQARVVSEGSQATIIAYGAAVLWAQQALKNFDEAMELIDLRTLCPLDTDTIVKSVKKTGRVLLISEDNLTGIYVLRALALHIGLQENYFDHWASEGNSILRPIHYPPITSEPKDAVRAGAHGDINLITLLMGASAPGLQVQARDGKWLDAIAQEDELVINVGDMLQRHTNNKLRSTIHRVVNPPRELWDTHRYSIPFFLHPRSDMKLNCLDACVDEENPKEYDDITAGDFLHQRLVEIGLIKE